jgi:MOSC domain-containing protein YiiM
MATRPDLLGIVEQVLRGRPRLLRDGVQSSLGREPVASLKVGLDKIEGDQCADARHHGGAEKVLHHYPLEHLDAWQGEALGEEAGFPPGAFGENLSTRGVTEEDICVGDVIQIGSAVLQVSQGRQPCWKLNVHFGRADMASVAQQKGRLGWYYRVIEPGVIAPGDTLRLQLRPHPRWPLARVHRMLFGRVTEPAVLTELADLIYLSPSWKKLFTQRLRSGQAEDFSARLDKPLS